jgi:hypothetical protein
MRLKPIHVSYSLSFLLVSFFKNYFGLKSFEKRITRINIFLKMEKGRRAARSGRAFLRNFSGYAFCEFFEQVFERYFFL